MFIWEFHIKIKFWNILCSQRANMFCCIITANCHLHRDQTSQPHRLAGKLQATQHKRLDRYCSVDGKGSLASNVCIFYTTYWQLRDLHTWGNEEKGWAGGPPAAQVSWELFEDLHYKRLQGGAGWCDRALKLWLRLQAGSRWDVLMNRIKFTLTQLMHCTTFGLVWWWYRTEIFRA